jgi:hypothetical protein
MQQSAHRTGALFQTHHDSHVIITVVREVPRRLGDRADLELRRGQRVAGGGRRQAQAIAVSGVALRVSIKITV